MSEKKGKGSQPRDPVSQAFGDRIRLLRERAGLTLEQQAERSGVSRAMLSKVERGEKSPTIGIVMRISNAVGCSMSALLSGEQPRSALAVRAERDRLTYEEGPLIWQVMLPTVEGTSVEMLRHILAVGKDTGSIPPSAPGTEKFVLVEKGSLTLRRGTEEVALATGDTAFFEADDVEHVFTNTGEEAAAYLVVTSRCLLAMPSVATANVRK